MRWLVLFVIPIVLGSCLPYPTRPPIPISTPHPTNTPRAPSLPSGYEFVNDDYIDLSFAFPKGWTNETHTNYGGYESIYTPSSGSLRLFRAAYIPSSGIIVTPEDFISNFKDTYNADEMMNFNILDEYEITIAGQIASVMEYVYQYPPQYSMNAFSIVAVFISSDKDCYLLQWSSLLTRAADARTIFTKMIPLISLSPYQIHRVTPTKVPTSQVQNQNSSYTVNCTLWSEITLDDVNKKVCVWGEVRYKSVDRDALYLGFGNAKGDFYILAYNAEWTNVNVGDCVSITEKILQLGASPVIVWDEIDKLTIHECK